MQSDLLRTFFGYNRWASGRLLDLAEGMSADEFQEPGIAGGRLIRDSFVHLIHVHKRWLSWWDGSMTPEDAYMLQVDPEDFPDVTAVRTLWLEMDEQNAAFIERLADEDAARVLQLTLPNGDKWELLLGSVMLHVANHSTQHRGEIAAMLTEKGRSPVISTSFTISRHEERNRPREDRKVAVTPVPPSVEN